MAKPTAQPVPTPPTPPAAQAQQPLFARLRALAARGPMVVAHRGASASHPENTLAAFRAAAALGAPMQEFDVQVTADGRLVCLHDPSLDRTTDAARQLGPGALAAGLPAARIAELDAGSWKGPAHAGERVPTLAVALGAMLPDCVPMIEHKAGAAEVFVAELRRLGAADLVLLQSFDWEFVAAAGRLCPEMALGLLGPTAQAPQIDGAVLAAARACGAGLVHWHAQELRAKDVQTLHAAGLLVCTYTSDDELSWWGGAALGVDAMCTNDPARMLAMRLPST